ncbi:MAG: signal transduction histidine kinase [Devosia sp.]|nr:signal transduction histidine kinase [Devosia sp.]
MIIATVDLTNCDREPIHIPGSIQPHGALLACDANLDLVIRHSVNAPDLLGFAGEINGSSASSRFGQQLAHDLRNALAAASDATRPGLLFGQLLPNGKHYDIAVHRYKSTVIVEFELAVTSAQHPLQTARAMIGRISRTETLEALMQQAARVTRATLGYDRVMIYRFERDGAGKVISEVKRPELESFLGQYFPGSDIPKQARALYLKNTIRIISESDYQPIPVLPVLDLSGEPLDLSFAHLRSVSPIHLEYLRNMGVGASMSISIIVDGELWGLLACHHYSARTLPMGLRVSAEMFGEFLSLQLTSIKQRQKLESATRARTYLDRVLQLASQHTLEEVLFENLADFGRLLPSDGFAICIDGRITTQGTTPALDDIPALARFVATLSTGRVWATHQLSRHFAEAEIYSPLAAGVLAIPLSQLPRDYLLFFRKERIQTLEWAGDPDKSYDTGPYGDRLTPRKSFAIWKETVHLQSEPWSEADREIAEAARGALVEVVLRHSELLADERAKADVRQRMLNEELNHRVKNILSVIKSLVGQPVSDGRSLIDYVTTLRGRIQALSNAHDQVIRGDGGGGLGELLAAELGPYDHPGTVIALDGPPLAIDSRAFSVMALVLHELATNAAKYGALSRPGGRVDVQWTVLPNGDGELIWTESGGPEVKMPSRQGFGTALVDRSVPFDLGGESLVEYLSSGVRASFRLPARHLRIVGKGLDIDRQLPAASVRAEAALPPETKILMLEDQMLIAMDVETMLGARGLIRIVTTSSVDEALRALAADLPDIAMLDINLGAGTSIPVAEELRRLGVPFIFATGYGEGNLVPPALADVPVVRKPYEIDGLLTALGRGLRLRRG